MISESEVIELLLLRNRGDVDAPEMRLFDSEMVENVFIAILRAGHLRGLDSIPAMRLYPGSSAQFVFSSTGRVRFYQLERLLAASPSGNETPESSN